MHRCAIRLLHSACFSFLNCLFLVCLLYSALLSKGPFKEYGSRPPYILASTENNEVFIVHSCRESFLNAEAVKSGSFQHLKFGELVRIESTNVAYQRLSGKTG